MVRALSEDRRVRVIEAVEAFLPARVDTEPEVTLAEPRERLWCEKGMPLAIGTLGRF